MRLFPIGIGQAGSMVAEQVYIMAKEVWESRGVRILAGKREDKEFRIKADPISHGVLIINSADADLNGIRYIPDHERNRLRLGSEIGHAGHGAGKDNFIGSELAKSTKERILDRIGRDDRMSETEVILLIASTAGGTGSGSIGLIVNWLKQSFGKPVYAMLLLPFESECDNRLVVENTATCLAKVLGEMEQAEGADAVILVDNQSFAQKREGSHDTDAINRKIAYSLRDLSCANEEQDYKYVSRQTLDAQDAINAIKGVTAIGYSERRISKGRRLLRSSNYLTSEKMITEGRKELIKAIEGLSIDCEERRDRDKLFFKAEKALCLFSAPPNEGAYEMGKTVQTFFTEHVPGVGLWYGVYVGGPEDTIGFTVILSRIGAGEATKTVQSFLDRGVVVQDRVEVVEKETDSDWKSTMEKSDKLKKKI